MIMTMIQIAIDILCSKRKMNEWRLWYIQHLQMEIAQKTLVINEDCILP